MIDKEKRIERENEEEKVKRRIQVPNMGKSYRYQPATTQQTDYYNNDVHQRVGIYVRVSTGNIKQTTSYYLQSKYYEEFVTRHPNWTLVKIYADKGISGTSLNHRDEFNQMIRDCKAGKLDLIITKSVSRFARNVVDFIGTVRNLAEQEPPIGVFFESEAIYSLNDDNQVALSFQAAMADEESHVRSRSMESSLRMRLDHGLPLTPKLLGYKHNADGQLIINEEEAPTVKLVFFMYLYGYSTQQIADALTALERKTYLGNIKWTAGSIVQILRNERHCGDVWTRKTYTLSYRNHKSRKNRGQRPRTYYDGRHQGIVSTDDFNAVQRMLDNAKYGNKSFLPELRVIDSGMLRGFVVINPRWAGFKEKEYYMACQSTYTADVEEQIEELTPVQEIQIRVEAGDFDLRGFEIARSELFDSCQRPAVSFSDKRLKFNTTIVRKFGANNFVEILVHPLERKFAVRPTDKKNRNAVQISKLSGGIYYPRDIDAAAYFETLYSLFDWNTDRKYRIIGSLYEKDDEIAYIFNTSNSETFFNSHVVPLHTTEGDELVELQALTPSGKRIRAIPQEWTSTFGRDFYLHEQDISVLEQQSEEDWKLRLEGRLIETGQQFNVTSFEELKQYINQELSKVHQEEATND